ncbi:MAG TPA: hypothetical protein VGR92_16040 [Steroidobacteraceae bacterium]|nr:hypothetical protein [Steroidobacteraceae bacterium]
MDNLDPQVFLEVLYGEVSHVERNDGVRTRYYRGHDDVAIFGTYGLKNLGLGDVRINLCVGKRRFHRSGDMLYSFVRTDIT